MTEMHRVEALAGDELGTTIEYIVALASMNGDTVVCEFNGVDLVAEPFSDERSVAFVWYAKREAIQQRNAAKNQERLDSTAGDAIVAILWDLGEDLEDMTCGEIAVQILNKLKENGLRISQMERAETPRN